MGNWLKNNTWLAWTLVGILLVILLYIFFKPVPKPDNSVLQARIDSLTSVDKGLRKGLRDDSTASAKYRDSIRAVITASTNKINVLSVKVTASNDRVVAIAQDYEYYKAHGDTAARDSACDLLAKRVILDSADVADLVTNQNNLTIAFSAEITNLKNVITQQANIIAVDSSLIANQAKLNTTQQGQIKKLEKTNTLKTIAGGVLIVGALVAGILIGN